MRIPSFSGAVAALALTLAASTAQADVLFQSVPDLAVSADIYSFCSGCFGSGDTVVDGFTATTSGKAGSITVAVDSTFFGPSAITVDIWSGLPDALGAHLLGFTVDPVDFTASSDTAFSTTLVSLATPTPLTLLAGHSYSIGFSNPDTLLLPGFGGGNTVSFQNGISLANFGTSTGFRIEGDLLQTGGAPEPAAWALMIAGFLGAGAMLRRQRAAA